jgi:hypothetical protein
MDAPGRANLRHGSSIKDDLGDIYGVVERIRESSTSEVKTLDELRTKFDQILLQFTGFKSDAQLTYKDIESVVKSTGAAVDVGFRETRRLLETISTTTTTNAETLGRFERVLQAVLATLYELRDAASTAHEMRKGIVTSIADLPGAIATELPSCALLENDGYLRTKMESAQDKFIGLNDKTIPRLEKVVTELMKEYGYDPDTGIKREEFFVGFSKLKKAIINNLLSLLASALVLWAAQHIAASSINEAKKSIEDSYKQRITEQDERMKHLEDENRALQQAIKTPRYPQK